MEKKLRKRPTAANREERRGLTGLNIETRIQSGSPDVLRIWAWKACDMLVLVG